MKSLRLISRRTLVLFMIVVLSLFCFSCSCFAEQTITIKRYNELMNLVNEQSSQLETLENKVKTLKATSPQLVKQLTECQSQLAQAKDKLSQSQTNLQKSQNLLESAEKEIYGLRLSLKNLQNEIDHQKRIGKRRAIQKAIYSFLGGCAVGFAVK